MIAVGDRVRLIYCSDESTRLEFGSLGTVRLIDSLGTIHVRWDNGSRLGMIPGIDRIEVVARAADLARRDG